jgi:hypothetical protein
MALTYLKNKVTGELREIEAGSKEYLDLAAQRIRDFEGESGSSSDAAAGTSFPDQQHRPLWEDRGVAGHAEAEVEPAVGNINDRDYDASLVGHAPELGLDTDLELATGSDRETHAKVANSGTTALDDKPEDGSPVKAEDKGSSAGPSGPSAGSSSSGTGSQSSSGSQAASGAQSGSATTPAA